MKRTSLILAVLLASPALAGDARPSARPPSLLDVPLDLPADRLYESAADSPGAVAFRHDTHVVFADGRCTACHPARFGLLQRGASPRHEEMDKGRACGGCHDGAAAFATTDEEACGSCHGTEARPALGRRLLVPPVMAVPSNRESPGVVSFRHGTHVGADARCRSCHPRPFAVARIAAPLTKDALVKGAACGACHDGRTAFSVEDERCERCHGEEGR